MLKAASLAVILTLFTASLVAGDGTQKPAATQPSAPVTPGPGMEPAVRTRIDIKCPAGPTITISTTKSGRCATIYDSNGSVIGGHCDDGAGNTATADCTEGAGACSGTRWCSCWGAAIIGTVSQCAWFGPAYVFASRCGPREIGTQRQGGADNGWAFCNPYLGARR